MKQKWDQLFDRPESDELLSRLAIAALADHRAGATTPLDPDNCGRANGLTAPRERRYTGLDLPPARTSWLAPVSPVGVFLLMDTIVFIDGQNLYHLAKDAWHANPMDKASPYAWPSYDVEKIADALVSREAGRTLSQIRFYTGVPNRSSNPYWHGFWTNKLRYLSRRGIYVYQGKVNRGGQEKGVDVSLALDLVQATHERRYDVAIIVSQDSDFGPAVSLAKQIAASQNRMLTFESAFPVGPGSASRRGIHGTNWVHIDQAMYDACLDPRDYRPARR